MSATAQSLNAPTLKTAGQPSAFKSTEAPPKPTTTEAPPATETPSPTRSPLLKRPVFKFAFGLVAVLALGLAGRYYWHSRAYESTDNAFIQGTVTQISPKVGGYVTKVYVRDNQHVKQGEVLVELDARDYENRLAQAKAQLQAAQAQQKTAQLNVGLTSTTSAAAVKQAAAGLSQAQANVQSREAQLSAYRSQILKAQAQTAAQVSNVEQMRAQLVSAQAEAARAQADAQRYQQLFAKDEVSRQQFETAQAAARSTAARVTAAQAAVTSAEALVAEMRAAEQTAQATMQQATSQISESQAGVGEASGRLAQANAAPQQIAISRAQVESAGAAIAQAEAAVAQAELELSHTKILAPADGIVTKKAVVVGDLLAPGQPLLALVPEQLHVIANFKETQLTHIRPGQPVEIKVDAYADQRFHGHVESIQHGSGAAFSMLPPENATGNYVKVVQRVPVKIVFDTPPDPNYPLGPGMSVEPEVKVR